MKYVIFVLLVFMYTNGTSQEKYIFKYRTDTVFKCLNSPDGTCTPWEGIKNRATKGFLVILDLTHLKISTYLKKTTNYSITSLEDHFTKDDNGQFVRIECVDDNNIPCKAIFRMVDDNAYGLDASICIIYPEYRMLYILVKQ